MAHTQNALKAAVPREIYVALNGPTPGHHSFESDSEE